MSNTRKPISVQPFSAINEILPFDKEGIVPQPAIGITAIPLSHYNPSAPIIQTDPVTYLEPDYVSFANVVPNEFIYEADTTANFLAWAESNQATAIRDGIKWVRSANAITDDELLAVVNGDTQDYVKSAGRSTIVVGHAIATLGIGALRGTKNILPGTIRFSNNAGTQMIHVKPGLAYLASPRHSWGAVVKTNENFIQNGNITIVRIPQGEVGFAMENGHPIVLLPGRHAFNNPQLLMDKSAIYTIKSKNVIKFSTITIVRVFPNELGLAYEDSKPVLLLPGIHIKNSPTFQFRTRVNTQSFAVIKDEDNELPNNQRLNPYLEHGNISIARVNVGELGAALDGREPVMLKPGLFIRSCRTFKFIDVHQANKAHIENHTIHLIRVNADQIGLAWDNNKAIFLDAKFHEYNSSSFRFDKFVPATEKLIKHGTLTRVRINEGEIGFAWNRGVAQELTTGIYTHDDSQFIFEKTFRANDETITFGNITRLIVKEGEARPVWIDGVLQIKTAGIAEFNSPKIIIGNSITLQDVVKTYKEILVTTRDRMPMHVTGQIKYCVKDPAAVMRKIGQGTQNSLDDAIQTMTHSALRAQISRATLSMISADHFRPPVVAGQPPIEEEKRITLFDSGKAADALEGDDGFRGVLCHGVLEKLRLETASWGVDIEDFAINDIGYQNKKAEENLAKATEDTRAAEAKLDFQMAQNAVQTAQARGAADKALIEQQNIAERNKINSENEAVVAKIRADMNYDNAKRKAEADVAVQNVAAEASLMQAQAKSAADKATAEGKIALAEAEKLLLNNSGYLQLQALDRMVKISENLANMQTPAVILGGGGESVSSNSVGSMFLGQGMELVKMALTKQGLFAQQPNSSTALLEDKAEHGAKQTLFHS